MGKKPPTHAVEEERLLDDLIEHPLQRLYNGGLSKEEFRAFAANVKKGLREKIQILPANMAGYRANTVLDGHKRMAALMHNGEKKTTVIVRYDLAEADELTVEKVFLEFNSHREHRDVLLQARTVLRLFEIEKKRKRGELRSCDEGEARDRVGKTIGMSGRNLNRYFRVLKTSIEVQNAFRTGKLSLVVAEKAADLDDKTQRKVAERIRTGEDPKTVITEYLPKPVAKEGKALNCLLRALAQGQSELGDRIHEVKGGLFGTALEELRKGKDLIDDLIDQLERNRKRSLKTVKRLANDEEE